MSVTSPDFESGAYTNFATPAQCGLDGQAILVAAATPRQLFGIHPCSIEKQVESSKKSARIHPKDRLPTLGCCYTIAKPV